MNKRKIVIVGGGTAGWMTAGFLAKFRDDDITVIESANIPKLFVGESVTPHVCNFLTRLGINEHHWMESTGAVYKFANKFVNWNGINDQQYFSFTYTVPTTNFYKDIPVNVSDKDFSNITNKSRSFDVINAMFHSDEIDRFDQYFNPQHHYMEKNVMPRFNGESILNQPFSNAHHVNAELIADYIRDNVALPNGVTHIIDTVVTVNIVDKNIKSLMLESKKEITADLFIDCTGLARILSTALDWPFKKYNTPIDSAWVCQTDYETPNNELVNYTQSIAEPYGWRFKIGLYYRMGNGYCYSGNHISDDDALDYFTKQIGSQRITPKLLKWVPGRLEKFGEGNCAAIGLSCGFTEPLEANALYTIVTSILRLNNVLDGQDIDFTIYNEKMAQTIDDIKNFILVHYTLGQRVDTNFWKDMKALGVEENHKKLVIDKIYNEKNTMKSATEGYTMFPDYMWAQLATHWGIEYFSDFTDPIAIQLAKQFFIFSESKHNMISAQCTNNYEWHKENIFQSLNNKEWEQKYVVRR